MWAICWRNNQQQIKYLQIEFSWHDGKNMGGGVICQITYNGCLDVHLFALLFPAYVTYICAHFFMILSLLSNLEYIATYTATDYKD